MVYPTVNICIGLTPLYRIGPRSDSGRRTGAMSGKVFLGRTDGQTADKKRRKNCVLGSPQFCRLTGVDFIKLGVLH